MLKQKIGKNGKISIKKQWGHNYGRVERITI